MKQKVIVIVGPTAVGKTKLSIELAKELNTEIISGDSAQVYRGLDIGTAKVTKDEMEGIPHHLIDIKDPDETFSVYEFQKLVRSKIDDLNQRGKIPILVGGTGLYVRAVLYDYRFIEGGRTEAFEGKYEGMTNEELHLILRGIDPLKAKEIHPNNRRRILRLLDLYDKGVEGADDKPELLYDAFLIGLNLPRELLYERINERVNLMLEQGLLDEVNYCFNQGIRPNIIGYKEFIPYFEGEEELSVTIDEIKKNSRRLAKRQLTFFRNQFDLRWFEVNLANFNETISDVVNQLKKWLK